MRLIEFVPTASGTGMPAVIEALSKTPGWVDASPPLASMDSGCTE
jgi:hypothetical protein